MHWVVEFVGCLSTKRTRNPMRLGNLDVFPCNEVVTCTEACVSSPEKCIVVQLRKCEDDHERVCFGPDTFISLTPSVLTHLELLLSSSAEDISVVHVPDAVREIPSECFYGCRSIRCVRFSSSSSLERICERAFSKTSLTEISIPDGVLELCSMCFWSISSFRRITFGAASSLLRISHCVFTSLHEISIPDSVRELCDRCFRYCYDITTITFGASSELERIGNEAFSDTRIREIHIPDSVREIGNKCFYVCIQLRRVIFGVSSSLQRIGDGAFYITALRHISIPASVRELGENCFFPSRGNPVMLAFDASTSLERIGCMCFSGCHLTFFRVPPSIRYIHPKAFRECILTDGLVCSCGCFNDLHGCLMVDQSGSICSCWIDLVHEIFVPDSVRELGDKCFFGYHLLTRVNFGSSSRLERIGVGSLSRTSICELNIPDRVEHLCDQCFCACKKLTRINFCATSMAKRFGMAMSFCNRRERWSQEVTCLLEDVSIPDSVVDVDDRCFCNNYTLKRVIFGAASCVIRIGIKAFQGTGLTEIAIPDSVRELCSLCFYECKSLTRVSFSSSSCLEHIGCMCFSGSHLTSFEIPATVRYLHPRAFYECDLADGLVCSEGCFNHLHDGLLVDQSWSICSSCINLLHEIFVPDSVRELGDKCFFGYYRLTRVNFGSSSRLERIGVCSLSRTSICELNIPDRVEYLCDKCFCACKKLTRINFCASSMAKTFGRTLLSVGPELSCLVHEIIIPDSVLELCDECFFGCNGLKRVTFGKSSALEYIGFQCFVLSTLESFRMPSSVKLFGGGAFNSCPLRGLTCSKDCLFCERNCLLLDRANEICYSGIGFLNSVCVPDSVRELCDGCFYGCCHLEYVTFSVSSSLEHIGSQCFALSGLRSFRMPASVNTIGSEVFRGCLLQEGIICDENCGFCLEHGLLLDKSCTICYGAIKGRYIVPKAMEIYVPNGVRELCDRCFYGCTFLEIVSFGVPCSLERIGCECFKRCRLISFEIPSSVTSVGSGAFNECHIKNGLICSAQCHFCVKNNLLLDKSGTICYSGVGFFRVVNVPDSVRELCDRCFYGCEHLERVNFGIRSSIERIGSQCFVDCCLQYIYFGMPPSCMCANHTLDKCPGFDRSLFRRIANPASTSLYERATEDKVQENQSAGCLLL